MKDSFLCTLSFLKISVASSKCWFSKILQSRLSVFVRSVISRIARGNRTQAGKRGMNVLLRIPGQQRQVQNERHPVAVDQEQDGQESVDAGLGDDVHVQAVAEIDRVDVVAFQVRVHDREEDLKEEVDGIEQDGKEEQPASVLAGAQEYVYGMFGAVVVPSFSSHFGGICGVMIR